VPHCARLSAICLEWRVALFNGKTETDIGERETYWKRLPHLDPMVLYVYTHIRKRGRDMERHPHFDSKVLCICTHRKKMEREGETPPLEAHGVTCLHSQGSREEVTQEGETLITARKGVLCICTLERKIDGERERPIFRP